MWPGGLDHCTPGLLRTELPALMQRKYRNVCFSYLIVYIKPKVTWRHELVITFIFVEHSKCRGGGIGIPQSHGSICRAGEEALVCVAVNQAPNGVCVSTQRSTQHWWVCHREHMSVPVSRHDLIWQASNSSKKNNCSYHRSRRGQYWGWGCSNTG